MDYFTSKWGFLSLVFALFRFLDSTLPVSVILFSIFSLSCCISTSFYLYNIVSGMVGSSTKDLEAQNSAHFFRAALSSQAQLNALSPISSIAPGENGTNTVEDGA